MKARVKTSLQRLIGRLKKVNGSTVSMSLGSTGLTVGITLMMLDTSKEFLTPGAILAFTGIALCLTAFILSKREDEQERAKDKLNILGTEAILEHLQNINNRFGELIKVMRQERNERKCKSSSEHFDSIL